MTIENENPDNPGENPEATKKTAPATDVAELVKQQVEEALKPLKEKLNNAYKARDDALGKVAEFERKEREAELKRLEEEGKHKEAYEMRLAEERAAREALEKRNTELTRDLELRNALSTQPFRNDNALEMAYKELVSQFVRNDQGVWLHKSGVQIRDFVKTFAESPDNEFLFKPKTSSGSGSSSKTTTSTGSNQSKSIFELTQEEVLKRAREGTLRRT